MASESNVIRAFVAIQLPDSVRESLREVQAELQQLLSRNAAAWTNLQNLHLTLRFLGNVDAAKLPALAESLRKSLMNYSPLELVCERLGCFPDLRFPRVIWAWVHDTEERLADLHRRVDRAVAGLAEKPSEPTFTGHITLARPKDIRRPDAGRLAEFVNAAVSREFGRWTCREVELVRSELSPSGSRYTTLDAFRL